MAEQLKYIFDEDKIEYCADENINNDENDFKHLTKNKDRIPVQFRVEMGHPKIALHNPKYTKRNTKSRFGTH